MKLPKRFNEILEATMPAWYKKIWKPYKPLFFPIHPIAEALPIEVFWSNEDKCFIAVIDKGLAEPVEYWTKYYNISGLGATREQAIKELETAIELRKESR
jgi:hypothetical protein